MALAYTLLKLFQSGTDANVYVIPTAFTPPANQLLLLAVASNRNGAVPSVPTSITGNGLTWVPVDNQTFNSIASPVSRLLWYRSMHASPSSGQATITFPETQQNCLAIMLAVSGTHLGGTQGSGAIGQIVKVVSDSVQTLNATLAAFASATNGAVYAVAKGSTTGMAPKAGWSEVGEQGSASTDLRLQVQFIPTADTAPSCTWAPSAAAFAAGIAFEILELGGGPYTLAADPGSYAITGPEATLRLDSPITHLGVYGAPGMPYGDLDHQAAGAYTLTAEPGAYGITGSPGGLLVAHRLDAAVGAYAITGAAATLIYAPVGAYTLTAEPGVYGITGSPANLLAARRVTADPGVYALTGSAAGLLAARRISADPGAYVLAGAAASLLAARRVTADPGVYTLTGAPATLTHATPGVYVLNADPGVYALTGSAAVLSPSGLIAAWIDFVAPAPVMSFRGEAPRMAFRGRSPQVEFTGGG